MHLPICVYNSIFWEQSSEYLSVLIGHEGEGSLLSLLKNKNWATSLTAGPNIPYRGFATFQVSMGLTKEGFNNTEQIICHVFEVCNFAISIILHTQITQHIFACKPRITCEVFLNSSTFASWERKDPSSGSGRKSRVSMPSGESFPYLNCPVLTNSFCPQLSLQG